MKVLKRREYATIAYDYTLEDICDTWSWDDSDSEVLNAFIDYTIYSDGSTYYHQYEYEVREALRDMLNDYVWGVEPETFDYNTDDVYDTIEEN